MSEFQDFEDVSELLNVYLIILAIIIFNFCGE